MENLSIMKNTMVRNRETNNRESYFVDQHLSRSGFFSSSPTPKIKIIQNYRNIFDLGTADRNSSLNNHKIYIQSPSVIKTINPIDSRINQKFKLISLSNKAKTKISNPCSVMEIPNEEKLSNQKKIEVINFQKSSTTNKEKDLKRNIRGELENKIAFAPENARISEGEHYRYISQLQKIQLKVNANSKAIDEIQYKLSILATLTD